MSITECATIEQAQAVAGQKQIEFRAGKFHVRTGPDLVPEPQQAQLSAADMSRNFTDAEILSVVQKARTDDAISVFLFKFYSRPDLDKSSPEFAVAKAAMVAKGVLTQARADAVFG